MRDQLQHRYRLRRAGNAGQRLGVHGDLLTVAAALGLLLGAFLISLPLVRMGWHGLLAFLMGLGLNMAGLFLLAGLSTAVGALRKGARRWRPGDRAHVTHGPYEGRTGTVVALLPDGGASLILDDGDAWDPPVDVREARQMQRL